MTEERARYVSLSPQQRKLLDYLFDLSWGEVLVVVKNGLPVMVKRERKDIKLTD